MKIFPVLNLPNSTADLFRKTFRKALLAWGFEIANHEAEAPDRIIILEYHTGGDFDRFRVIPILNLISLDSNKVWQPLSPLRFVTKYWQPKSQDLFTVLLCAIGRLFGLAYSSHPNSAMNAGASFYRTLDKVDEMSLALMRAYLQNYKPLLDKSPE